jgi:DNA-binding NarL/FixJ family response regulator
MANLFLIDPHPIVRAGIRSILGDLHAIAGEADDASQAAARIAASFEPVALAVLDPNGSPDAIGLLTRAFPQLRIVIYQDSAHACEAGAHAFVSKRRDATRLRTAVDAALRGDIFHDPVEPRPHDRLSPREHEVLRMVMGGMRPKEIALELNVSVKTISTHRFRLMRKLGVDNDVTLMRYAFRNALAGA